MRCEMVVAISSYPLPKSSRKRSSGASDDDNEECPEFILRKFRNRRFIHAPDAGNNLIPVQKKKTSNREKVGNMPMSIFCLAARIAITIATTNDASARKSMLLEICEYSSRSIKSWRF